MEQKLVRTSVSITCSNIEFINELLEKGWVIVGHIVVENSSAFAGIVDYILERDIPSNPIGFNTTTFKE